MLINPIVAIASVAVRAVGTLLGQTVSPTNQYFDNMIEDNFMSHPSPVDYKDAVILNREQEEQSTIYTENNNDNNTGNRVKPPPHT